MTKINILFGTESGNAEMAAEDLCNELISMQFDAAFISMEDAALDDCKNSDHVILITSTYGEGELPETAVPFYQLLQDENLDLSKVRFSAFGLGDSSYENYNNAISIFSDLFNQLNAQQVGEIGKFDASSNGDVSEAAIGWSKLLF